MKFEVEDLVLVGDKKAIVRGITIRNGIEYYSVAFLADEIKERKDNDDGK